MLKLHHLVKNNKNQQDIAGLPYQTKTQPQLTSINILHYYFSWVRPLSLNLHPCPPPTGLSPEHDICRACVSVFCVVAKFEIFLFVLFENIAVDVELAWLFMNCAFTFAPPPPEID